MLLPFRYLSQAPTYARQLCWGVLIAGMMGCEEVPECQCPHELIKDRVQGKESNERNTGYGAGLGADMTIPFKSLIDKHIEAKGQFEKSQIDIEETYWEIVGSHPDITQRANLFLGIACWKYVIICENSAMPADQKTSAQLQVVSEYENNINRVLNTPEESVPKPSAAPSDEGNKQINKPERDPEPAAVAQQGNVQPLSPNTPPAQALFNLQYSTDIAILESGDAYDNTGYALAKYYEEVPLRASQSFFRPAFLSKYQTELKQKDIGLFTQFPIAGHVNCVCHVDQRISFSDGELAGSAIIKGIGNYKFTLYNLLNGKVSAFELEIRGAGGTEARALEDMTEKLALTFSSHFTNLAACKK